MKSLKNFVVYEKSIALLAVVAKVMEEIPQGNANLVDQLKRSALSVPLNVAEGAGKT